MYIPYLLKLHRNLSVVYYSTGNFFSISVATLLKWINFEWNLFFSGAYQVADFSLVRFLVTPCRENSVQGEKKWSITSTRVERTSVIFFELVTFGWLFDCEILGANLRLEALKTCFMLLSGIMVNFAFHGVFERDKDAQISNINPAVLKNLFWCIRWTF